MWNCHFLHRCKTENQISLTTISDFCNNIPVFHHGNASAGNNHRMLIYRAGIDLCSYIPHQFAYMYPVHHQGFTVIPFYKSYYYLANGRSLVEVINSANFSLHPWYCDDFLIGRGMPCILAIGIGMLPAFLIQFTIIPIIISLILSLILFRQYKNKNFWIIVVYIFAIVIWAFARFTLTGDQIFDWAMD